MILPLTLPFQDQALRHLKQYTTLFAAFATTSKSEIVLLNKIQEYCYENMNFLKTFNKIVLLLYKSKLFLVKTRKYSLRGYILGVPTHTTALDQLMILPPSGEILNQILAHLDSL